MAQLLTSDQGCKTKLVVVLLIFIVFAAPTALFAQFNSNIQGTVADPGGAVVPSATIQLTSVDTGIVRSAKSGSDGIYHFVSIAPGSYKITASAQDFANFAVTVNVVTGQTLDVPITLHVGTQTQSVQVTGQAPLLDTAETRSQVTLGQVALTTLPLGEQSVFPLMALAPGVQGLGTDLLSDIGTSTSDFSPQITFDLSANGRGPGSNMFVVDGLDVTSDVCDGCINLTPMPVSVQEMSIQSNTFSVEQGRGSGLQVTLTTKPGTAQFHGALTDTFNYQNFWAKTEFINKYAPFHSDNVSGAIGGPIWAKHNLFFFGSAQILLSLTATGNTAITYEAPEFVVFAKNAFPNTVGTTLLTKYAPSRATTTGVALTAGQVFPGSCGTSATGNVPCSLPMVDRGVFNASNYLNGDQYHGRIDKYFTNDRIFGSYYGMNMHNGGPAVRPGMETTNPYSTNQFQVDETHTISTKALNEADFALNRVFGNSAATGAFSVPGITVQGMSSGIGATFIEGDYIQNNYHWRDVLTRIVGAHTFKVGYEGHRSDEYDHRGPTHDHPNFVFTNLLNLVEDEPYSETNLSYNPLNGDPDPAVYDRTTYLHGVFAEDTWKVTRRLTVTPGLRWDDYGNPFFHDMETHPGNFFLGAGNTFEQQVANGSVIVLSGAHMLNRAPTAFSPRIGFAWDPAGDGKWVLRGGAGFYHDWAALGQSTDGESTNPPAFVVPTFLAGSTTEPIFALGKSNTSPFGFPYPTLSAPGLNSHGGLNGEQVNVAAINPNLRASYTYNYSTTLERAVGRNLVAQISYSGSDSTGLLSGSDGAGVQSYGTDINRFAGDLIINNNKLKRLNSSFGQVKYSYNQSTANYNGVTVGIRGTFGSHGFINASYTRSSAYDNAQAYPTANLTSQYWGPSPDDAPNRFSMMESYSIPALRDSNAIARRIAGGWELNSSTILQSGYPFTVYTSQPFQPVLNSQGQVVGMQPGSGDYNADGDNDDWPNAPATGYKAPTSRQAYLTGLFAPSAFGVPAMGNEGNELANRFRGPGFAKSDFTLAKNTPLKENVNLQLRLELYNIFNRPNLYGMVGDLSSGNFGRATAQYNPRYLQIGGKLTW